MKTKQEIENLKKDIQEIIKGTCFNDRTDKNQSYYFGYMQALDWVLVDRRKKKTIKTS